MYVYRPDETNTKIYGGRYFDCKRENRKKNYSKCSGDIDKLSEFEERKEKMK